MRTHMPSATGNAVDERGRYSSAHGTKISNVSKIQSAIVCCLSSLMAISLADHAIGETSV
jgi:hypothetical protein